MINLRTVDVGDRVIHSVTRKQGFIAEVRTRTPGMVYVKFEDAVCVWLHPEQVDLPSTLIPPPVAVKTSWGRTTPPYIQGLSKRLRDSRVGKRVNKQKKIEKAAEYIIGLSDKKQKRHNNRRKVEKYLKRNPL